MFGKGKPLRTLALLLAVIFVMSSSVCAHAASISRKSLTLKNGQTATLKVSGVKKVKWSSSRTSVATVSSKGKVKAKKAGTAKITAKSGRKKWTCTVKVKKGPSSDAMTKEESRVCRKLISLKGKYPDRMKWDNSVEYEWKGTSGRISVGCDAFATLLSDAVFGNAPARTIHKIPSVIRPGDIIRTENDTHTVIVLKRKGKDIIVAEGNYIYRGTKRGAVRWGRKITRSELKKVFDYLLTRYPGN